MSPRAFWLPLAVGVCMLCAPPASRAELEPSGAQIHRLCTGGGERAPLGADCLQYFDAALRSLEAKRSRGALRPCPPGGFGARHAAALFQSESHRYPDVLDVPAIRLIEGMLLKFFPCLQT